MAQPQTQHVLIIGAGLGGLTLAQALRKQNISFEIFERDESESSRTQGWALSLVGSAATDLESSLPSDLPPLKTVDVLHEHNIPPEGAIFTTDEHGELEELRRFGPQHGIPMIRASRKKLRQHLQTNISIHWNKKFTHYTSPSTSTVTAHFTDGTSYTGTCLIGADGINSRVRAHLLPLAKPEHIPMGVIIGELTASPTQYQLWMKQFATSFFPIYAPNRRMTVALKSMSPDKSFAAYYWLFNWDDPSATSENYWTKTASQADLHSFVMANLDGIPTQIADILRATKVDGILHPPLQLRQMVPPENIPEGRVTLLGDAIHPMTPFRGQGANMAMMDALSIAKSLSHDPNRSVAAALKEYEAEMRPRATQAVLDSSKGSASKA